MERGREEGREGREEGRERREGGRDGGREKGRRGREEGGEGREEGRGVQGRRKRKITLGEHMYIHIVHACTLYVIYDIHVRVYYK